MKKLLLIGAMLCALCSCGSSSSKKALTGTHEGQEWVDLGLPSGLKWATCNLGAENPEGFGDQYYWGATTPGYDCACPSVGKSWGDIGGNPDRDAATSGWGGSWRMPTKDECQELVDNCTWEWTTQDDHTGYKVTGPNGQSIFLPVPYDGGADYEVCWYWSSTPDESDDEQACILCLSKRGRSMYGEPREYCNGVRPVLAD